MNGKTIANYSAAEAAIRDLFRAPRRDRGMGDGGPASGGSPPPLHPLDDVAMYPWGVFCLPGANKRLEKIVTDIKSFADGVRDHATDESPHAHQAPERRSRVEVLEHLWPTLGESA